MRKLGAILRELRETRTRTAQPERHEVEDRPSHTVGNELFIGRKK